MQRLSRLRIPLKTHSETVRGFVKSAAMGDKKGSGSRVLNIDNMNPNVKVMEYAVRGPLVIRAGQIEEELQKGTSKKLFNQVIRANIGDCHAVGQTPLPFLRQVVAGAAYPDMLDKMNMPLDVRDRVNRILDGCRGHSIGSYTDSVGIDNIRKDVASYISKRDGGIASNHTDIFLCGGASDGIKSILKLLMTEEPGRQAGVMIPIPQYPLYTATIAEYNAFPVPYYLDEANKWALDVPDLERAVKENASKCDLRAIVVINPGNPTGQVLSKQNIEDVIKFAKKNHLFILADEVYQHNIYAKGSEFHSFKKVLNSMGPEYAGMELASFMSTSKGYMGECGFRGGYCEAVNLDPDVRAMLLKFLSAKLCPNVPGQCAIEVVVNPPKQGEPSYDLFMQDKNKVLGDLATKAKMTTQILNSIDGITCNEVMGAMYAFPKITIPQKAIDQAKTKGMQPDAFFCFELLEETGICVVPGSGFGQREGTFHFRTTILPPVDQIKMMLDKLKEFYAAFVHKYK
ncbi:hypothetical protein NP493_448g00003 [Ridgeia piscesae]|uniref:alanine transaminase n=1 Tax=Ridgeia piscesae TaxID=27915 RepID=A0AAD9L0F3_RIDPI|nr:hypothetical protein NP493_448g00003 [Ridgeia piscesae]